MKVTIRNSYEEEIKEADVTLFIDIFRASTTLNYIFKSKPQHVVGVNTLEDAKFWMNKTYLLVSEVFDGGFDNSPKEMKNRNLDGKKIVHKSSNLTNAVFSKAELSVGLIVGLVNVDSVKEYLWENNFSHVEIVMAADFSGKRESVEDKACAFFLKSLLSGESAEEYPFAKEIEKKISKKKNEMGISFLDLAEDVKLSLERSSLNTLVKVRYLDAKTVEYYL